MTASNTDRFVYLTMRCKGEAEHRVHAIHFDAYVAINKLRFELRDVLDVQLVDDSAHKRGVMFIALDREYNATWEIVRRKVAEV